MFQAINVIWSGITRGNAKESDQSDHSVPMTSVTARLLQDTPENELNTHKQKILNLPDDKLQQEYQNCDVGLRQQGNEDVQKQEEKYTQTFKQVYKTARDGGQKVLAKLRECWIVLEQVQRNSNKFVSQLQENTDNYDTEHHSEGLPNGTAQTAAGSEPLPNASPANAAAAVPPRFESQNGRPNKLSVSNKPGGKPATEWQPIKKSAKLQSSTSKQGKKVRCSRCNQFLSQQCADRTGTDAPTCAGCMNEESYIIRNGHQAPRKPQALPGLQQQQQHQQRRHLEQSEKGSHGEGAGTSKGSQPVVPRIVRATRQSKPPEVGATRDNAIALDDSDEDVPDQQQPAAACTSEAVGLRRSARSSRYVSPASQLEGLKVHYQVEGSKHSVTITAEDLSRLQPTEFLNDTVIEFYMRHLQKHPPQLSDSPNPNSESQAAPSQEPSRFYFFNTFFYKKLVEDTAEKLPRDKAEREEAMYERVKRWTKNVDIFSKDYIFVPIHSDVHWSLAVICQPGKIVNCLLGTADKQRQASKARSKSSSPSDPQVDESTVRPAILHLDSLKGCHKSKIIYDNLCGYLRCEWAHRAQQDPAAAGVPESIPWRFHQDHPDIDPPKFDSTQCDQLAPKSIPQQDNGCDCGLFVLAYIEFFMVAAPPYLTKEHKAIKRPWHSTYDTIQIQDTMLTCRWFDAKNTFCLRAHIEYLIKKVLLEEYADFLPKDAETAQQLPLEMEDLREKINHLREYITMYETQADVYGEKYIPAAMYNMLAAEMTPQTRGKLKRGANKGKSAGKTKAGSQSPIRKPTGGPVRETIESPARDTDELFNQLLVDDDPDRPGPSNMRQGDGAVAVEGVTDSEGAGKASVVHLDQSQEVEVIRGTQETECGPEELLRASDADMADVYEGGEGEREESLQMDDGDDDDEPGDMSEGGEREQDELELRMYDGCDEDGQEGRRNSAAGSGADSPHVKWEVRRHVGSHGEAGGPDQPGTTAVQDPPGDQAVQHHRSTRPSNLDHARQAVHAGRVQAPTASDSDSEPEVEEMVVLSQNEANIPDAEYAKKITAARYRSKFADTAPSTGLAPAQGNPANGAGSTAGGTTGQPSFTKAFTNISSDRVQVEWKEGRDHHGKAAQAGQDGTLDLTTGSPHTPHLSTSRGISPEDYVHNGAATEPVKQARLGPLPLQSTRPHTTDAAVSKAKSKLERESDGGQGTVRHRLGLGATGKQSSLSSLSMQQTANAVNNQRSTRSKSGTKTQKKHERALSNLTEQRDRKKLRQTTIPTGGSDASTPGAGTAARAPHTHAPAAEQVDLAESSEDDDVQVAAEAAPRQQNGFAGHGTHPQHPTDVDPNTPGNAVRAAAAGDYGSCDVTGDDVRDVTGELGVQGRGEDVTIQVTSRVGGDEGQEPDGHGHRHKRRRTAAGPGGTGGTAPSIRVSEQAPRHELYRYEEQEQGAHEREKGAHERVQDAHDEEENEVWEDDVASQPPVAAGMLYGSQGCAGDDAGGDGDGVANTRHADCGWPDHNDGHHHHTRSPSQDFRPNTSHSQDHNANFSSHHAADGHGSGHGQYGTHHHHHHNPDVQITDSNGAAEDLVRHTPLSPRKDFKTCKDKRRTNWLYEHMATQRTQEDVTPKGLGVLDSRGQPSSGGLPPRNKTYRALHHPCGGSLTSPQPNNSTASPHPSARMQPSSSSHIDISREGPQPQSTGQHSAASHGDGITRHAAGREGRERERNGAAAVTDHQSSPETCTPGGTVREREGSRNASHAHAPGGSQYHQQSTHDGHPRGHHPQHTSTHHPHHTSTYHHSQQQGRHTAGYQQEHPYHQHPGPGPHHQARHPHSYHQPSSQGHYPHSSQGHHQHSSQGHYHHSSQPTSSGSQQSPSHSQPGHYNALRPIEHQLKREQHAAGWQSQRQPPPGRQGSADSHRYGEGDETSFGVDAAHVEMDASHVGVDGTDGAHGGGNGTRVGTNRQHVSKDGTHAGTHDAHDGTHAGTQVANVIIDRTHDDADGVHVSNDGTHANTHDAHVVNAHDGTSSDAPHHRPHQQAYPGGPNQHAFTYVSEQEQYSPAGDEAGVAHPNTGQQSPSAPASHPSSHLHSHSHATVHAHPPMPISPPAAAHCTGCAQSPSYHDLHEPSVGQSHQVQYSTAADEGQAAPDAIVDPAISSLDPPAQHPPVVHSSESPAPHTAVAPACVVDVAQQVALRNEPEIIDIVSDDEDLHNPPPPCVAMHAAAQHHMAPGTVQYADLHSYPVHQKALHAAQPVAPYTVQHVSPDAVQHVSPNAAQPITPYTVQHVSPDAVQHSTCSADMVVDESPSVAEADMAMQDAPSPCIPYASHALQHSSRVSPAVMDPSNSSLGPVASGQEAMDLDPEGGTDECDILSDDDDQHPYHTPNRLHDAGMQPSPGGVIHHVEETSQHAQRSLMAMYGSRGGSLGGQGNSFGLPVVNYSMS